MKPSSSSALRPRFRSSPTPTSQVYCAPPDAQGHVLAQLDEDMIAALDALAEEVGARSTSAPVVNDARRRQGDRQDHARGIGGFARRAIARERNRRRRGGDDGARFFRPDPIGAAPHDWLSNMGGSIGLGMPLATGAAVACPDRKVITLEGDGSAMYTLQALWTQAREGLDVTTLLFSNRSYAILRGELANVGAGNPGRKALDMLDLGSPDLDFVTLPKEWASPARGLSSMEEFNHRLAEGHRHSRPVSCRSRDLSARD